MFRSKLFVCQLLENFILEQSKHQTPRVNKRDGATRNFMLIACRKHTLQNVVESCFATVLASSAKTIVSI